jgi:hypothetical protein
LLTWLLAERFRLLPTGRLPFERVRIKSTSAMAPKHGSLALVAEPDPAAEALAILPRRVSALDQLTRRVVGDGLVNLFRARAEVLSALDQGDGELPASRPVEDALPARIIPSVAAGSFEDRILAEIEQTIEAHRAGKPARIALKMNALVDARCIQALYQASQAGVRVDLNVRGICCLRPGVPGVSENIHVVSVVGRFLEHSRIYAFERGEETRVFFGSADLMPRNLDSRVELVTPIEDTALRAELVDTLERCFADNTNAWTLDSDGRWARRRVENGERRSVQEELQERHAARATEQLAAIPS